MAVVPMTFPAFYADVFLPEHRHPLNVGLHVAGIVVGAVGAVAAIVAGLPWLVLLYPLVHALPGLIGHRLFERNPNVGDVRVNRRDFPPTWFIAGNHRMAWELCSKGFHWRAPARAE